MNTEQSPIGDLVKDRINHLDDYGRAYLLGWLTSAIVTGGSADANDLLAALPLAERWQRKMPGGAA